VQGFLEVIRTVEIVGVGQALHELQLDLPASLLLLLRLDRSYGIDMESISPGGMSTLPSSLRIWQAKRCQ